MKKKIMITVMTVIMMCGLVGCTTTAERVENNDKSMFVVVETTADWDIVYHKETKVMYAVAGGTMKAVGVFTVLVNPDGTPMLYKE